MAKIGRPTIIPEPWRSLASKAGGVDELAKQFGVSQRTVYYWIKSGVKKAGSIKVYSRLMEELEGAMQKD
jgi:transposase-like protein